MPKYGLLIEYEFCVGCRACELACKQEHNRPDGEWSIYINRRVEPKQREINYTTSNFLPRIVIYLCGKRVAKGLQPSCVYSCWAGAMKFSTIEQLAENMRRKPRTVIWAPH